jgi:O-antigen/teichoic acid export membrane protein
MVVARMCDRLLGLVSMVILARLLVPDDFGIVAMAMSVVALLGLLRAFGFDVVLIQHRDLKRAHYDTAFTLNLLVSLLVSLLLVAMSAPAAVFFGEPELTWVMVFLAFAPAISSLLNIGVVDFRKNLEFRREFLFMFLARIARFVVTVSLAFSLRNHWALVFGILIGRGAEVLISYVMHPYRPRISLAAWRELFGYSKWLVLGRMTQVLIQRSADFVIGRFAGARALGLFNVSYEIAFLPSSELAAPVNRAIFPGYARQAEDPDALRQGLLDVVSVIGLGILPAAAGLMVTAPQVVLVLLSESWAEAIPLIPVLALAGMINALGSNTGLLFLATGRPQIPTYISMLRLGVLLPALLVGVHHAGALGAAWAYVASLLVAVLMSYAILMRQLKIGVAELFARIWRPVIATTLMVLSVRTVAGQLPAAEGTSSLILQLLGLVSLGASVYCALVLALWYASRMPAGAERFVVDAVSARLGPMAFWRSR